MLAEQLGEKLKPLEAKISRTRSFGGLVSVRVIGKYTLIDLEKTSGIIRDLLMKTTSSDFSLRITLDGEDIVENTFTEIATVTEELEDLVAFQEGNVFTVHATSLGFRERAYVVVVTKDLTFTPLYALVDILA